MSNQKQSTKIFIISDLHISKFTGQFNEEAFTNGIMSIASKLKKNPETLLLNLGDITDEGTFEDYIYANTLINGAFTSFGVKNPNIYYLPGNHDFRNVGMEIWKEFYGFRHFFIDTTKLGGNVVILGIDSVEPDMNSGRIGNRGMEEILAKLSKYPDHIVKILCFHHHLLPIPKTGRERSMIVDAGEILPILWETGVDIVIVGHRHFPHSYTISNGIRRILLINNGTFSSNKTRGKAGRVYLSLDISEKLIEEKFIGIDRYSTFQKSEKQVFPLKQGNIPSYPVEGKLDEITAKVCHLSCTHFSPGGDFQKEIYEKGIEMIVAENPNLIVHCGNLTNDSFPEDYAIAKHYLRNLKETNIPIILVPGTRDLHPFGKKLWISQIGPLDPIYDNTENFLHVFGINTGPDSSGNIGRGILNLLRDDLENLSTKRVIIVAMHHACIPIPRSSFERTVRNAGDSLDFFTNNQIPVVLSGLEHHGTSLQVEKTVFVNAGTFSSKKIKSKRLNTYNVLTFYRNRALTVEEIEIHSSFRHLRGIYEIPTN
ncbi:MAG: metallophosphoesterase family protein [Candidatus Hodarchaeota archaeon]